MKPKKKFNIVLPNVDFVWWIDAYTKSEARSHLKKTLKLKRLPVGTEIKALEAKP